MPDHNRIASSADPELLRPREGSRPGPDCPSCGAPSTRLSRGRYWCASIRCDAVFVEAGPLGLTVIGRVARDDGMPVTILPTARPRDTSPRLGEGLGDEVPISTTDMTWYALRCEGGHEEAVRNDLGDMRLATYVPIRLTWRQTRRHHYRKGGSAFEPIERPLFGGYVMLGAWRGFTVDWLAVRGIKRVLGPVLAGDDSPSTIPGAVVRSLIHREVAGEFRDPAPDAPRPSRRDGPRDVRVGDRVEVGGTGYADKVLSIEGIYAALERSGMKVHLDSLKRAG